MESCYVFSDNRFNTLFILARSVNEAYQKFLAKHPYQNTYILTREIKILRYIPKERVVPTKFTFPLHQLPMDLIVVHIIRDSMSYEDIQAFCQEHPIFDNEAFWEKLNAFSSAPLKNKPESLSWKTYYLDYVDLRNPPNDLTDRLIFHLKHTITERRKERDVTKDKFYTDDYSTILCGDFYEIYLLERTYEEIENDCRALVMEYIFQSVDSYDLTVALSGLVYELVFESYGRTYKEVEYI
jgi:hypothetical protein